MNFRTTLVLLVLLAGVGIFLFLSNRGGGNDDENAASKSKETEKKLLAFEPADVEQVTVAPQASADAKPFTLARSRGAAAWRLTSPVDAATDSFAVDSLVREVTDLKSRNTVPLDADKQGLAKPAYTVTMKDKAGKTTTLAVGARLAVGDTLYVKLNDEHQAHVVPGSLIDQLEKPAMSYRQTRLVETSEPQVEGITLARAGEPAIKVDRTGPTEWKVTKPVAMPAEPSEVTGLVTAVTGMSATEFVAEDSAAKAAQYGLDKPQLTVSIRTKAPATQPAVTQPTVKPPAVGSSTGGATTQGTAAATQPAASQPAPIVIKFGRYTDVLKKDVYAALDGGPVVKLPVTSLDNFKKTPLELRDRKVVDINPESVERVTITRDLQATTQPSKRDASKATIVIARRQEKFIPAGPPAPTPAKPEDTKPSAAPAGAKSDASGATPNEAVLAAAEEKAEPAKDAPKVEAPPADAAKSDAAKSDAAKTDAPKAEASKPDAVKADAPKPDAATAGPAAPAPPAVPPASAPSTKPATGPSTTQSATAPTTQLAPPAPPPSKFVLESDPKGDASDAKVQSLLDSLHPLRVQKYLAAAPKDAKPVGTYTLKVETASSAGKPAQTYEIKLSDPGSSGAITGQYGDVNFELERFFLPKIEGGFEKGAAAPEAPPMSFPGGLPGGGPGGGGLGLPGE